MPLILNIETATEICSVAVSEGDKLLALSETNDQFAHAKTITLLIEDCLKKAGFSLKDLDAVAVSKGPGSYTALRIGVSAAKGICYALDKPLIAVDTLRAIAWATFQEKKQDVLYVPMIDARRVDVYSAVFDSQNNPVTETGFEVIVKTSYKSYFASENTIIFSGNGAEKCKSILISPYAQFSSIACSAAHLRHLSHQSFLNQDFEDLAYFVPNYHKAPNITTPKRSPLV